MNLHLVDYLILGGLMLVVLASAWYTQRFTRSVADFLSANRCAGRYLLTVASTAAGLGTISIVAMWEKFYQAGFGAMHWGQMLAPIALILSLSGWIIYRYRQTRSMTLAQFLEKRYSRNFRVFAGVLCWVSGILNYGIFPAVTARFFVYFLGLPVYTTTLDVPLLPGGLTLNWTLGVVMAALLAAALFVTLNGGQVAVMVSDWVQGQVMGFCFIILLGVLLWMFPWPLIVETLSAAPAGKSMLNPFDQGDLPDFNPLLFLMLAALNVYNYMVWQGSQGYNSAAKSPHEAKMAGVIAQFRNLVQFMIIPLAAVCAYVLLHAPVYEAQTLATQAVLDGMGNEQMAKQMTTTVALSQILPMGVMGLLAAVMVMAALTTDSTYLHSWGSIFVQDVVMPIRQIRGSSPWTPRQHLLILRGSVLFVAVFAWVFSMVFPLQEYIVMYFQITGAVFTAGAGAVLIGGLYWKRGTASGAWAAMITGSVLAVTGIVLINLIWPNWVPALKADYPDTAWLQSLPEKFWLNGVQMAFFSSMSSALMYVIVSMLSPDPRIDTDRLFHRGAYAPSIKEGEPADRVELPPAPPTTSNGTGASGGSVPWWQRRLGITAEFTRGDKLIYAGKYLLFLYMFGGFVVLTTVHLTLGWMDSDESWATWWLIVVIISASIGVVATVWFLIGGIKDLRDLFRTLGSIERDAEDDGTVPEAERARRAQGSDAPAA